METYNQYHRNPKQYNFLSIFEENCVAIRNEYNNFLQDKTINFDLISQVMTPHSKTITTKKTGTYEGIGLLFHGKSFLQLVQDSQLNWTGLENDAVEQELKQVFAKHFKLTLECVAKANALSDNGIRNVYFSVFKPGLDIKCHINYNPHIYRGYLGLIVPPGDIAMKICGETLHWHEGEIMVLDHTFPHCPHNRTTQSRVALIVDFFQPDKNRNEMVALEKKLVDERMKTNPYGFGVFGDEDYVSAEDLKKYGFDHQEQWSSNLL